MKKVLLLSAVSIMLATGPSFAAKKVAATVNGKNIYQEQVSGVFRKIPKAKVKEMGGTAKVRKIITENLAAAEALKQAALDSNIEDSKSFKKLMKDVKEKLIQQEYVKTKLESKIKEQDIKKAYEKALADFKPQMEYELYNISLKTEDNAKKVIKQLNNGANFEELAGKESIVPDAAKTKGKIGFITIPMIKNEDVAKAVKSMKVGTYSKKPVKGSLGWNVFYLKSKRKEKALNYKDAKESIKQALYRQEMAKMMKKIKEKATIEYK